MDHRLASHFAPKINVQGPSNVVSTQAHTAKQRGTRMEEEIKKIQISAEVVLPIDNPFYPTEQQKHFLPKSFDCVMVPPETQKPDEPDSVPSEKGDDATQKASSHHTAYFSCKDAGSSNERKSFHERGIKLSEDRELASNSLQNHSLNLDLPNKKRESDATLRHELKLEVTVSISEDQNYVPNKSA